MDYWSYIWTAAIAYFVGSIPTGYVLARARGIDIRSVGSGNIGATNVFRILGTTAGVTVLLIDALKGFVPPKFVNFGTPSTHEYHAMLAGICAILGHNYTLWLRFKGGKGIATSAGVLLAWTPYGLAVALGTWLVIFGATRYVSLASIAAAFILPFGVWATGGSRNMIALTVVVGVLAIYKHKSNIGRLMAGTENRVGAKKKEKG